MDTATLIITSCELFSRSLNSNHSDNWLIVEEPNLKKCLLREIIGAENLYILNAEVVLMTVWSSVFPNQWEYYGRP